MHPTKVAHSIVAGNELKTFLWQAVYVLCSNVAVIVKRYMTLLMEKLKRTVGSLGEIKVINHFTAVVAMAQVITSRVVHLYS